MGHIAAKVLSTLFEPKEKQASKIEKGTDVWGTLRKIREGERSRIVAL